MIRHEVGRCCPRRVRSSAMLPGADAGEAAPSKPLLSLETAAGHLAAQDNLRKRLESVPLAPFGVPLSEVLARNERVADHLELVLDELSDDVRFGAVRVGGVPDRVHLAEPTLEPFARAGDCPRENAGQLRVELGVEF